MAHLSLRYNKEFRLTVKICKKAGSHADLGLSREVVEALDARENVGVSLLSGIDALRSPGSGWVSVTTQQVGCQRGPALLQQRLQLRKH